MDRVYCTCLVGVMYICCVQYFWGLQSTNEAWSWSGTVPPHWTPSNLWLGQGFYWSVKATYSVWFHLRWGFCQVISWTEHPCQWPSHLWNWRWQLRRNYCYWKCVHREKIHPKLWKSRPYWICGGGFQFPGEAFRAEDYPRVVRLCKISWVLKGHLGLWCRECRILWKVWIS